MWCNFTNTEIFGFQPVKVFETQMHREFKNIRTSLNTWFPNKNLDEVKLEYKIGKYNLVGPYASSTRIHLSETFLSAFWNFCYGITLATPSKLFPDSVIKKHNPYESLSYCKVLFDHYEDWDIESLPNPELREKDMIAVINFVNHIYSVGLYFIILHEFTHIIRGDMGYSQPSKFTYHQMEFSCDSYAFDVFAASTDLNDPTTLIGLLCAVGIILYSSTFEEKYTEKHPFPDERLLNILHGFELYNKNINDAYIFATWILISWDFLQNEISPGMPDSLLYHEDYGEPGNFSKLGVKYMFFNIINKLQDKKSIINNSLINSI